MINIRMTRPLLILSVFPAFAQNQPTLEDLVRRQLEIKGHVPPVADRLLALGSKPAVAAALLDLAEKNKTARPGDPGFGYLIESVLLLGSWTNCGPFLS